ncbi:MAG: KEOPS complex subunit Pcc1 [Candidatus Diapherotrites archaeon]|nr:KEOPS complex subunit Pcc1 [Candidatus Diapherotrites archaeon]
MELEFESAELAQQIKECVFIELNKSYERRSQAKLLVQKNKLILKVNATDLFALRATVRSLLQGIVLTYDLIKNFN